MVSAWAVSSTRRGRVESSALTQGDHAVSCSTQYSSLCPWYVTCLNPLTCAGSKEVKIPSCIQEVVIILCILLVLQIATSNND